MSEEVEFTGKAKVNDEGQVEEVDMDMPKLQSSAKVKMNPKTGQPKDVVVKPYVKAKSGRPVRGHIRRLLGGRK